MRSIILNTTFIGGEIMDLHISFGIGHLKQLISIRLLIVSMANSLPVFLAYIAPARGNVDRLRT